MGYMKSSNIEKLLRDQVREALFKQRLTQAQLAEKTGIHRVHINKMLNGQSGKFPNAWERVLEALGLEVQVKPKKRSNKVNVE